MAGRFRRVALTGAVGAVAALGVAGVATSAHVAGAPSAPVSDGGVRPYIVANPGPGGNVTCAQLGYTESSGRMNFGGGAFAPPPPAGITVDVTQGTFVEWSATFEIDAVIVKGSNQANVYEYEPPSMGDSGLAAPPNSSGQPAGLSNLTFCWNAGDEPEGGLSGAKYYDANANGRWDAGEPGIQGWPILWSGAAGGSVLTDADGLFDVTLAPGTYNFAEAPAVGAWIQTGNTVDQTADAGGNASTLLADKTYDVTNVDGGTTSGLYFGNVCVGAGGGLTPGFWSNKNGQRTFESSAGSLPLLVNLNLATKGGDDFDPDNYTRFRNWLRDRDATNMAYMLSAHLAAMALNVHHGFVDGAALVYAPDATAANAAGFATVNAIIAEADAALAANKLTVSGDPDRAYQEMLKDVLDAANNNQNFLQNDPALCPPVPVLP